jgi:poly-beta-1,6-N-acetyl-D-glucosamine synthase
VEIFQNIVFVVFILSTAVQLFYWLFVFSRVAFHRPQSIPTDLTGYPPVSVVICARNEAENLKAYLPKILEQDYPNFEVVVVNDDSADNTANVLNNFARQYPHLRIITVQEKKLLGKKGALAEGIAASRYEWLLLTDADCYPLSKNWIAGMVSEVVISKKSEIVLGYAPYENCDNSFLNKFIRFETVWTATQYLGFALAGMPYMAVGRNYLYNKNLYESVNGFLMHADIPGGDDDLFVNQVITKKNFSTLLNAQTFMVSKPKPTWNAYFTQKTRHFSTGKRYLLIHQLILASVALSHFFYFVTPIYLLYSDFSTMFVPTSMAIRTMVIWTIYSIILKRFNEHYLFWYIPLFDVVLALFFLVFTPATILRTVPRKWK